MSLKLAVHSPPQTYSRLFRPWDTSANREKLRHTRDEMPTKNSANSWQTDKIVKPPPLVATTLESRCDNDRAGFRSFKQLQHQSFDHGDNTVGAQLPLLNQYADAMPLPCDPYTMGLMEQEYARIMAEDARTKIVNSRKQRPKKFKCPHCEVAFSNNGQLRGHIRIHTGERPFKCAESNCGKTFTRNEELTRHKRIHTGLRPFACSSCGKKFGRRDHLKKHTKTHFAQEKYFAQSILLPIYPYMYGY